jgi:hypothetical protein
MVTMLGYTIDLDELARCRKLIDDHAESFGKIGLGLGPDDSSPSWVGAPPAASRAARASRDLHMASRTQFSAAQEFLRRVAQELGGVGLRTTETELANVAALRRVSTTLR